MCIKGLASISSPRIDIECDVEFFLPDLVYLEFKITFDTRTCDIYAYVIRRYEK